MNQSFFKQFLNFDKMITPNIIIYFYLITSLIFIIIGFITLISGIADGEVSGFFLGVILIILAPFLFRIVSEILLIQFKILEKLNNIDEKFDIGGLK